MTERNTRLRMVAMLGAAAIGVTTLMGAGSAAFAAPQGFGDIDFGRDGSLTVHKYLHQVNPKEGDISQAPAEGDYADPVSDVIFTAYPLLKDGKQLNLKDAAEWNALGSLAAGEGCTAPAGYALGSPITLPATDAKGTATVTLPIGAFQVCETSAPSQIIDAASPFIVTVPMPHKNGWVYDVHAYPKNGEATVEKTIEQQQETGLGSVVKFPVTAPVPTTGDKWTGFALRDTLDERLTPVDAANMPVAVNGEKLDSSYYTLTVAGQQITMNFTETGLVWLNEGPNAQAGKKIQVVFAGTVTKLGNGTITNQAELWPNNPGFDPSLKPPVPSNEVETHWGNLQVQKRAAGTSGEQGKLNGATFEVYNAADPYAADCSAAEAAGDPVTVEGKTSFTSAGTGVISIAGLFVSDSVNPVIDAQQRCYVLKEIAAPAGFVLPADPFTAVTVKVGETTVSDNVEIVNTQQDVPELPLTGAAGQILLIIGGIAAVAIAMGLVLVNRRRQSAEV
ncbi:MAG: SpaH/EbpB family LPXTG-anchored major pilin [Microbacteriaceae bacterium]